MAGSEEKKVVRLTVVVGWYVVELQVRKPYNRGDARPVYMLVKHPEEHKDVTHSAPRAKMHIKVILRFLLILSPWITNAGMIAQAQSVMTEMAEMT